MLGQVHEPAVPVGHVAAGRYEVLRMIGRGGMADVFEAKDRQVERMVALKLLRGQLAMNHEARARFTHEAHTQEKVRHRNVAVLYDAGFDRNVPFLAMELLGGRSMAHLLTEEKRVDGLRAAVYGYQALQGLAATHAVNVLHRDLKPGNLMLEPSTGRFERVVLIDFGFAALGGVTGLTRQGVVVGSPSYMAPERLRGEKIDERSDLYSVGAMLYELMTGRPPFQGDPSEILAAHLSEPPAPPSTLVPGAEAMDEVILRALAKDPAQRAGSALEMADELERAMQRR
jgi:serine/threonine-protein kinase